jgi:heat shock protein HslJ
MAGTTVLADAGITFIVDASGSVGGSGGCNEYHSTATVDGDAITLAPIAATLMACAASDVMTREQQYFSLLQGAATWAIDAGSLTITTSSGETLVYGAPAGLSGSWALSAIDGSPIPGGVVATADFADGTVSGSGGCNRYSAPYTVDGGKLTVGPVMATRRACSDAAMTVENEFLARLGTAASWEMNAGQLVISAATPGQDLTFTSGSGPSPSVGPEPTPVASGAPGSVASSGDIVGLWTVVSIGGMPLPGTSTMTLAFGADGRLTGNGGCNDFSATYQLDGDSIGIGPIDSTKKACGGLEQLETALFQIFALVDTWSIEGDQLTLGSSMAPGAADILLKRSR